jgi:hypothetical protein
MRGGTGHEEIGKHFWALGGETGHMHCDGVRSFNIGLGALSPDIYSHR